jgi:hypothetical protein
MCRFRSTKHTKDGHRAVSCISWFLLALATTGCRPARQTPLDEDARQYVRLAVALGERDPDSLDFYAGPADAVADIRRSPPPLAAIKREAEGLTARIRARRDSDPAGSMRAAALVRDLAAIAARIDLLTGVRLRYDQESVSFFGIAPGPIDEGGLDAIRSRIAVLAGGRGRLVDRYAAFAARFTIPPERLQAVMTTALDACRGATLAQVALPPGEHATLEFVHDRPWSAFSRYLGGARSVIQVNADFRFTIDQALQIACHEGYPGHHARNTLRTSASGGERAVLAADIAFSPDERIRVERDRLFPLANLAAADAASHVEVEQLAGELQQVQADVARRYLDGQLEFARAVAELEARALVPHAEVQLKYINEFRSYVTTYTTGRTMLAARLRACEGVGPAARASQWRCFRQESLMP